MKCALPETDQLAISVPNAFRAAKKTNKLSMIVLDRSGPPAPVLQVLSIPFTPLAASCFFPRKGKKQQKDLTVKETSA